jgi:basic membrane protein A and related proteins
MKKRKFGFMLTSVAALSLVLAACGDEDTEDTSTNTDGEGTEEAKEEETASALTIAMVTDTSGIDDKSFNQATWEGVKQFAEENGLTQGDGGFDNLQSTSDADYLTNLNQLARRDFELIFAAGFSIASAVEEIADQQKDTKFTIIDSVIEGKDNVASVLFKEQEGSFLAGVAAAMTSTTGKVGFIGGMESEVITRFEVGFKEGVAAVDPNIDVDVVYVGSWTDSATAQTHANRMYQGGVDVIMHAAGGAGNGLFTAAKDIKEKDANANVWVIGVDSDQFAEGETSNGNVTLTSMIKNLQAAVMDISNKTKEGNFPGGELQVYGLAEDGVYLSENGGMTDEVKAAVKEYTDKIASGEITVPEK